MINDLVGLKPVGTEQVVLSPLVPEGKWDWFCLDNVSYHGHMLTIVWDKTGAKYGKGKGLLVFSDGKKIASAKKLGTIQAKL